MCGSGYNAERAGSRPELEMLLNHAQAKNCAHLKQENSKKTLGLFLNLSYTVPLRGTHHTAASSVCSRRGRALHFQSFLAVFLLHRVGRVISFSPVVRIGTVVLCGTLWYSIYGCTLCLAYLKLFPPPPLPSCAVRSSRGWARPPNHPSPILSLW
jgi:hypothetical protein